jgi:hypothetical protein
VMSGVGDDKKGQGVGSWVLTLSSWSNRVDHQSMIAGGACKKTGRAAAMPWRNRLTRS